MEPKKAASRTSAKSQASNNSRKFRGLACANCRARKVKCGGGQPSCKTCEIYNDECRYDKAPPISQVVLMAKRLQEAEKVIENLRAGNDSEKTQAQDKAQSQSPEPAAINDTTEIGGDDGLAPGRDPGRSEAVNDNHTVRDDQANLYGSVNSRPSNNNNVTVPQPYDHDLESRQHPASNSTAPNRPTPQEPHPTELSLDADGKICYYGPTSAVHDPPSQMLETPESHPTPSQMSSSARADLRSSLASFGRESATWEEFALGNAALETGIPRSVMERLLHLHWTWVSPMFGWVYRPAFIRDMATGGRHYSEFLLTVICAHAAKYQDSNCADLLLTRARRLLGTAIQQPSSIPTVQALLQLSARDLAHGSISQAWVYSGIAFRMASDLGLQHTGPSIRGLSPVDLEVRRRLFWSCYFWDKATSLYAGRLPAVTEILHPETLDLLDDSSDTEPWCPYYGDSLNLTRLRHNQYPPMMGHGVSCFANSCRLSIIINDIIVQLYSKRSRIITETALRDVRARLDSWRADSPPHLRYDPDNLPNICPPPHLISQNLLYFTTVILAHRPFWTVPGYERICLDAAYSIEKLVLLLESTFGLDNITYLMGYCIYTGASAVLEDARNGNQASNSILRTFLRALNTGMRRCPLLERSLTIIVKSLNRPPQPTRQTADSMPFLHDDGANDHSGRFNASSIPPNNYIPAFPFLGPPTAMDFDADTFFGSAGGGDAGSMAMLDCYPEMQMDLEDFIMPPV